MHDVDALVVGPADRAGAVDAKRFGLDGALRIEGPEISMDRAQQYVELGSVIPASADRSPAIVDGGFRTVLHVVERCDRSVGSTNKAMLAC